MSEAALIGGIADWFAVEALFRHPLGLPIPHTAIIPKSKDENGMEVSTQSSYDEEILRIIQQWMPHILILSPESLKERLKERVKGYLETI